MKYRTVSALGLSAILLLLTYFWSDHETQPEPGSDNPAEPASTLVDMAPEVPAATQTRIPVTTSTEPASDEAGLKRFMKVSAEGNFLSDKAGVWSCVYDTVTGLLWEVKRDDGGWQDREHTYSWFQPESAREGARNTAAGGDAWGNRSGVSDQGHCYGTACDTHGLLERVNEESLCGSVSWRMPEAHELRLLDHPLNYYPDIDTDYFPGTMSGRYWSRTGVAASPTLAWSVDFSNGFPYIAEKRMVFHARAVSEAPWLSERFDHRASERP